MAKTVTYKGICYEQVRNARERGFKQSGGVIAAIDVASGKEIWTIQVYTTEFNPNEEADVQEIYIEKMYIDKRSDLLIVRDEIGRTFVVDINNRTVVESADTKYSDSQLPTKPLSKSAPTKESPMNKIPSNSRIPPPDVPPIEHNGILYVQEMQGITHGFDQATGYLIAYDAKTKEQLWAIKVYEVKQISGLEQDVQWVFFKSMTLIPEQDKLLIENELGDRYLIDLQNRTSTPIK